MRCNIAVRAEIALLVLHMFEGQQFLKVENMNDNEMAVFPRGEAVWLVLLRCARVLKSAADLSIILGIDFCVDVMFSSSIFNSVLAHILS